MFERRISEVEVKQVLDGGEIVEAYPDDKPFPSYLMLKILENRAFHVVAADNVADHETIVITVYEPDPDKWDSEFKRRRQ